MSKLKILKRPQQCTIWSNTSFFAIVIWIFLSSRVFFANGQIVAPLALCFLATTCPIHFSMSLLPTATFLTSTHRRFSAWLWAFLMLLAFVHLSSPFFCVWLGTSLVVPHSLKEHTSPAVQRLWRELPFSTTHRPFWPLLHLSCLDASSISRSEWNSQDIVVSSAYVWLSPLVFCIIF